MFSVGSGKISTSMVQGQRCVIDILEIDTANLRKSRENIVVKGIVGEFEYKEVGSGGGGDC